MPMLDVLRLSDGEVQKARAAVRELHRRASDLGVTGFADAVARLETAAGLDAGLAGVRAQGDAAFAALVDELVTTGVTEKALALVQRHEATRAMADASDGVLVKAVRHSHALLARQAVQLAREAAPVVLADLAKLVTAAVGQAGKVNLPESALTISDAGREAAIIDLMKPADAERITASYKTFMAAQSLYERVRVRELGWLPAGDLSSVWFGWACPGRRPTTHDYRKAAVAGPVAWAASIARNAQPGLFTLDQAQANKQAWGRLADAWQRKHADLRADWELLAEEAADGRARVHSAEQELRGWRGRVGEGDRAERDQAAGKVTQWERELAARRMAAEKAQQAVDKAEAALDAHVRACDRHDQFRRGV